MRPELRAELGATVGRFAAPQPSSTGPSSGLSLTRSHPGMRRAVFEGCWAGRCAGPTGYRVCPRVVLLGLEEADADGLVSTTKSTASWRRVRPGRSRGRTVARRSRALNEDSSSFAPPGTSSANRRCTPVQDLGAAAGQLIAPVREQPQRTRQSLVDGELPQTLGAQRDHDVGVPRRGRRSCRRCRCRTPEPARPASPARPAPAHHQRAAAARSAGQCRSHPSTAQLRRGHCRQ